MSFSAAIRRSISCSVRGEYFTTACMCAHASSIASIALSGRMRSVTYLSVSFTAARIASSEMSTL